MAQLLPFTAAQVKAKDAEILALTIYGAPGVRGAPSRDHAGIARVLNAGVTGIGVPYVGAWVGHHDSKHRLRVLAMLDGSPDPYPDAKPNDADYNKGTAEASAFVTPYASGTYPEWWSAEMQGSNPTVIAVRRKLAGTLGLPVSTGKAVGAGAIIVLGLGAIVAALTLGGKK